ncbi:MAG: biotin/lipoyl-binding protein [Chloroflexi bacterium]|nr:biotin/lipoyl-binding protein [Chloroflexota bacterium]
MAEKYLVRLGDEESTLEVRREDGVVFVRREGEEHWQQVELERVGDSGLCLLMIDNHPEELYLERRRGGAIVTIGRHAFNYDVGPWRPGGARPAGKASLASGLVRITAPMTGSVLEVKCQPGERVETGATLLVIESMKMNNELRSPAAGVVESVPVAPGQRIKAGELLVSLQV